MRRATFLKQSALLFAAALAGAGVVLASRPAEQDAAQAAAAPRALPVVAANSPATPVAAVPPPAECSTGQDLAEWQLLSSGAGGYREPGFAVLHHPQHGTVTVMEGAAFADGVLLQRVMTDGVQLRCGTAMRSLVLPTAGGPAPAMRSALPDPERSASN